MTKSPLPSLARCSLPSRACSRVFSGETAGRPGTSSRPWSGFSVMGLGLLSSARLSPLVQPIPLRPTSASSSVTEDGHLVPPPKTGQPVNRSRTWVLGFRLGSRRMRPSLSSTAGLLDAFDEDSHAPT